MQIKARFRAAHAVCWIRKALSRRAQRFRRSDQKVHSVLAVVPRDPSGPCPNCYTFRGRHSGLQRCTTKTAICYSCAKLATRRTSFPCNRYGLFAFEKCHDVRKQFLATRLAHHTVFLARSTMRAACQSTNLTAPLRRLTYSAEPANVGLCAGIRPLEIGQKSKQIQDEHCWIMLSHTCHKSPYSSAVPTSMKSHLLRGFERTSSAPTKASEA
jgi:hypothetical protein